MDDFEHRQPCDATQGGHFRRDLDEEGLERLLKATIDTAIKAVRPKGLERTLVDTTVQEKASAHPLDSHMLEIARHKVASAAKPRRWLRASQTAPTPEAGRQTPAEDAGHRPARGAAQEQGSGFRA